MSLKRPFVPKSDVKQLFTTTTTTILTRCRRVDVKWWGVVILYHAVIPDPIVITCPYVTTIVSISISSLLIYLPDR